MSDPTPEPRPDHWQLLRDVLAFQFKLALDGLRDILLSPVSMVAAIVGLFTHPENPGKHFYRLLRFGHRSDRWINLFNSHAADDGPSSDAYVRKVENLIRNEAQRNGVVRGVKDQTDELIRRMTPEHKSGSDTRQPPQDK